MDEYDLTFVAFSPLAQARLLDKYDPANPPQFEPGDHRKDSGAFKADAINALKPKLAKLKGAIWRHDRRPGGGRASVRACPTARRLRHSRLPQRASGRLQPRGRRSTVDS